MDYSLSKELAKVLKKQKIELLLSHKVSSIIREGEVVNVLAYDKNEKEVNLQGDYCLISIGRKPYTEGLNLKAAGLDVNEKGQIEINDTHSFIREHNDKFNKFKILYGGSVKSNNAKEITSLLNVDGALIGGASLKSHEFTKIIQD